MIQNWPASTGGCRILTVSRTANEVEDVVDHRIMRHLLGAYFHQDFDLVNGDLAQTFEAFVANEPEHLVELKSEINDILGDGRDEAAIETILDELGCEIYMSPADGGYRHWLSEMTTRIDAQEAMRALRR